MNVQRKLEGVARAKRQLDLECACGGYTPQKYKKFEIKERKARLIYAPKLTEIWEKKKRAVDTETSFLAKASAVVGRAPALLPHAGREGPAIGGLQTGTEVPGK